MSFIKKSLILTNIISLLITIFLPFSVKAEELVDIMISNMTNEEKIAQMIMPSFEKDSDSGEDVSVTAINTNIETILNNYGFAGIALMGSNSQNVEQLVRLIDSFQVANAVNNSRPQLFISMDQEGGYVTRLKEGTLMPGNMALGATNDSNNAYEAASIIGMELNALGVNLDFAPVIDVNSNPSNPIIGVRSFSDDYNMVGEFGSKYIDGLQSKNVMTVVKHFPGHGDTSEDTHNKITSLNKTYDELKNADLIPFKKAIEAGTDMIMTSHISFPNIETNVFHSLDGHDYTLPATLSSIMLTDILRGNMGYNGVIITDSLKMDAISHHFEKVDAAVRAINAGADILLMPFDIKSAADFTELGNYITTLASKIGTEIEEAKVDAAVRRILTLKAQKGLLNPYDGSTLEAKITNAKNIVSSIDNHNKEFELSKKGVTLVKNDNNILPIKDDSKKTVIIYGWSGYANSIDYAIQKLINQNKISANHNITKYLLDESLENIQEQIKDADNVIIQYTIAEASEFNPNTDATVKKIDDIIEYAHSNNSKVIYLSSWLPYDLARFQNADALMAVYNPVGMGINPYNSSSIIRGYGPNVSAGIYMIFANGDHLSGKLPLNIPKLTNNYTYSSEILYQRGYGLDYIYDENKQENNITSPITYIGEDKTNKTTIYTFESKKTESKIPNVLTIKDKTQITLGDDFKEKDAKEVNVIVYVCAVLALIAIVGLGIKLVKNKNP